MTDLDLATVAAANDAWTVTPKGSEVIETSEYRLVRFPEPYTDPLQLSWVRSARPVEDVLGEIVERAAVFGLPEAYVSVKLSAPEGFDEALLRRGAELADTTDVLATALPADLKTPDLPGLEVRWRTEPQVGRDANTIACEAFGTHKASDEAVAKRTAADRETIAAGTGGVLVGYLDGAPAGSSGVSIADGVARLWGGAVLEAYRSRGVYRSLVAARLAYGTEHGATMALTQGRITTSSPILRRLGFVPFGRERMYRLPLG